MTASMPPDSLPDKIRRLQCIVKKYDSLMPDSTHNHITERLLAGWRLRLNTALDLTVPANWGFSTRANHDWHLIHTSVGQGWYWLDGQRVPLEPGRLIVISPGFAHSASPDPDHLPHIQPCRFSWLRDGTSPAEPWTPKPAAYSRLLSSELSQHLTQVLGDLARRQHQQLTTPAKILRDQADLALGIELACDATSRPIAAQGTLLERLCLEIRTRPQQHWPITVIAQRLGWSPKHAIRAFHQAIGVTPHRYVIQAKIARACFLLSETTMTMTAIANDLGYADSPAFAKQFRQLHNMTPGHWRSQHQSAPAT